MSQPSNVPQPDSISVQVKLTSSDSYEEMKTASGDPITSPDDFAQRVSELEKEGQLENASIAYWFNSPNDAELVMPRVQHHIDRLGLSGRVGISKGQGFDPETGEPKRSRVWYSHKTSTRGVPQDALSNWL